MSKYYVYSHHALNSFDDYDYLTIQTEPIYDLEQNGGEMIVDGPQGFTTSGSHSTTGHGVYETLNEAVTAAHEAWDGDLHELDRDDVGMHGSRYYWYDVFSEGVVMAYGSWEYEEVDPSHISSFFSAAYYDDPARLEEYVEDGERELNEHGMTLGRHSDLLEEYIREQIWEGKGGHQQIDDAVHEARERIRLYDDGDAWELEEAPEEARIVIETPWGRVEHVLQRRLDPDDFSGARAELDDEDWSDHLEYLQTMAASFIADEIVNRIERMKE